jgi:hypothetical protein
MKVKRRINNYLCNLILSHIFLLYCFYILAALRVCEGETPHQQLSLQSHSQSYFSFILFLYLNGFAPLRETMNQY